MNRREACIALIGLGAVPLSLLAQPAGKVPVIGIVATSLANSSVPIIKQQLGELGYAEGKTIIVEWRSWEGQPERLPSLMDELVRLNPDVIVAMGAQATRAAMRITSAIPIIFYGVGGDPVALGLVPNLARPGGNVTGFTSMANELDGKQIQILKQTVPKISHIAVLINPNNPNLDYWAHIQSAAHAEGVKLLRVEARDSKDLDHAFATVARDSRAGLLVQPDDFFGVQRSRIVALAAVRRIPAIFSFVTDTRAGGLMSYGPNIAEQYRTVPSYIDKILKGAKAGDLPVQRPMKFEFVVNKKTARGLGIKIPQSLLLRADRVIE